MVVIALGGNRSGGHYFRWGQEWFCFGLGQEWLLLPKMRTGNDVNGLCFN